MRLLLRETYYLYLSRLIATYTGEFFISVENILYQCSILLSRTRAAISRYTIREQTAQGQEYMLAIINTIEELDYIW